MAFSYEDQRQLLDLQAKSGRLPVEHARDELEKLMSAEADHLEKMAGAFWQDHGMARAYKARAQEVRDSIKTEVWKIGGTAAERRSLQKAAPVSQRPRGTTYAASPDARPIGMPDPSAGVQPDLVKLAAPVLSRPIRYRPTKAVKDMTRAEQAQHYRMLAGEADTAAHAGELLELAAALRKEED